MDLRRQTNLISLLVVIASIIIGIVVYIRSGIVFFAVIFAPPLVHWMLKKRQQDSDRKR